MNLAAAWIVATVWLPVPATPGPEAADIAELLRLETLWNEAHLRGDAGPLDRLWAADCSFAVPNMPAMTKAEVIGVWRSGRMTFTQYRTSDVAVRVYGAAAVVTGRLQRTRNLSDRAVDDDWRFTKVYVRRVAEWQVVAFHASASAR